ncbi:MAG: TonB-dependent receptor plug domain-containing protein, partial [Sphingopyxis sp.]|nr:TonB-dependent receptor plug domain-containing protein [Sphingopyxis sp.]
PQPLADAAAAVSVVALPDSADSDPGQDSAWAIARVDGVALAGPGAGRNRMFLRGVADSPFNGDSQSTVAVILDESRLTYSAPDPDIRLVDVDRVEVLKGPQGALYGTGALGGIYRIVTRRPDASRTAFEVGAGGELLASGDLGGSISAMANLPLARDVAALRLVAYGAKDPGWVDTGGVADSNTSTVVG